MAKKTRPNKKTSAFDSVMSGIRARRAKEIDQALQATLAAKMPKTEGITIHNHSFDSSEEARLTDLRRSVHYEFVSRHFGYSANEQKPTEDKVMELADIAIKVADKLFVPKKV